MAYNHFILASVKIHGR